MGNGRPRKWDNASDLEKAIDDYFNGECRTKSITIGKGLDAITIDVPVPTITGLAIHLGFESRQSFYDYEKEEGFSYTIKRARLFIEREYEEQLHGNNVTGAIFALKNMGWLDTKSLDHTTGGEKITPPIKWS